MDVPSDWETEEVAAGLEAVLVEVAEIMWVDWIRCDGQAEGLCEGAGCALVLADA